MSTYKLNTKNIRNYGVSELTKNESKEVNGGAIPAALIAAGKVAAVAGTGLGVILVGAAVGYGVYKLVQYVTK